MWDRVYIPVPTCRLLMLSHTCSQQSFQSFDDKTTMNKSFGVSVKHCLSKCRISAVFSCFGQSLILPVRPHKEVRLYYLLSSYQKYDALLDAVKNCPIFFLTPMLELSGCITRYRQKMTVWPKNSIFVKRKNTQNDGQFFGYSYFGGCWTQNCWHQVNFFRTNLGYNCSN